MLLVIANRAIPQPANNPGRNRRAGSRQGNLS